MRTYMNSTLTAHLFVVGSVAFAVNTRHRRRRPAANANAAHYILLGTDWPHNSPPYIIRRLSQTQVCAAAACVPQSNAPVGFPDHSHTRRLCMCVAFLLQPTPLMVLPMTADDRKYRCLL